MINEIIVKLTMNVDYVNLKLSLSDHQQQPRNFRKLTTFQ